MSDLPSPQLDDRSYEDLVRDALQHARATGSAWTEMSPSDPGVALVEAFAFLADLLIYRVNRIPEKTYIELLRLLGVRRFGPRAAVAEVEFRSKQDAADAIEVPAGVRVKSSAGPIFQTLEAVTVPPGGAAVTALCAHLEIIRNEIVGVLKPGWQAQTFAVAHPPIIEPLGADDLLVALEAAAKEQIPEHLVVRHGDLMYRRIPEAERLIESDEHSFGFTVDRGQGRVTIVPPARTPSRTRAEPAPEAVTEGASTSAPTGAAAHRRSTEERRVLVTYRRGGGAQGNLAANSLTELVDDIPNLQSVHNPRPATGGSDAESLPEVVRRGPTQFCERSRAVTAPDYEYLATRAGGVSAARAIARGRRWRYAIGSGVVDVAVLPTTADGPEVAVTRERLAELSTTSALDRVQHLLENRCPLGVRTQVRWANAKSISVRAVVAAQRFADVEAVRKSVEERVNRLLRPMPTPDGSPGWPFGRPVHRSSVIAAIVAEPGVSHVERLELVQSGQTGAGMRAVVRDPHHARVWYAAGEGGVYRSENDGRGWERLPMLVEGSVTVIRLDRTVPGRIAAVIRSAIDNKTLVTISEDVGETWAPVFGFDVDVKDAAWLNRANEAMLVLATDSGAYVVRAQAKATPTQIVIDPNQQDLAFVRVATHVPVRGEPVVALAASQDRGVFASIRGGVPGSFRLVGLAGEDVNTLEFQEAGTRAFLWAGTSAPGYVPGKGARRTELPDRDLGPANWASLGAGWQGGSLRCLAFGDGAVVAGSFHRGVARHDGDAWTHSDIRSGLPLDASGRLAPINGVALANEGKRILAATDAGLFVSEDGGGSYQDAFGLAAEDRVTIPPDWVVCPAAHQIKVIAYGGDPSASGLMLSGAPDARPT